MCDLASRMHDKGLIPTTGIESVSPSSIEAGANNALLTIQLNGNLAPPTDVEFTSITIGPSLAQPDSQATDGTPVPGNIVDALGQYGDRVVHDSVADNARGSYADGHLPGA